jgi:excisionase family DNA binding protein
MEELITIQDVAAYLKMSPQTIYRMAQQGRIPAMKVQNRWRFRRGDIESWLSPKDEDACRHVLVVVDEPSVAEFFIHVLEPEGYQVVVVSTGQMAIQKVQQHSFNLIYLNLTLPDLSGPETLRAIRQVDDTTLVAILMGSKQGNLLQEVLELGPFTVLVRPFGADEIIETAKMCV